MEIQEKVAGQYWSHCRGKDNPADLPSRGATLGELQKASVWLHGSMWLRETESSFGVRRIFASRVPGGAPSTRQRVPGTSSN